MTKNEKLLSQSVIDYLGAENSALLSGETDIYPGENVLDGVLWVQYDEKNAVSAVYMLNEQLRALLFTSENTDFDELNFVVSRKITTPDILPYKRLDKKYLLRKSSDYDPEEKGESTEDYIAIKSLENGVTQENIRIASEKIIRCRQGRCVGAAVRVNGEIVSGGFVTYNGGYAVITDVFTRKEYREKGCGTALVKKLLKLSKSENVYLVCEKKNIDFYEKLGFEIIKTVYEYSNS